LYMSVVWAGTRRVPIQTITFSYKGVKHTYLKASLHHLRRLRNVFVGVI
jgi:hypothetical protein